MNTLAVALGLCLASLEMTDLADGPAPQPAAKNEQAEPKPKPNDPAKGSTPDQKEVAEKNEKRSEADQIIRLQRFLDTDSNTLEKTKKELDDPKNEYHQAEAAYQKLESSLRQKRAELEKLKMANPKEDTGKLEGAIAMLEKQRVLARDRFEIAIKERKVLQEQVALLAVRIEKSRQAIALLQGAAPAGAAQAAPAETAAPKSAAKVASPPTPDANGRPVSMELLKAQQEAALKDAAAKTAKEKLAAINERMLFLNKNIDLDQRILEVLHEKANNTAAIEANLQKELAKKRAAKVAESELASLLRQLAEMEKLAASTAADIRDTSDRLANFRVGLKKLEAEKSIAQANVAEKSKDASAADERVKFLESPLAPQNIIGWLWTHVPKIAVVIGAMLLLHWLVRVASRRIVQWMTRHQFRGEVKDRANRADTLAGVFRNVASFLIIVAGTLMILQALGIPILPLLGGAAAGGLAVAFGAQNLIKDYLSGFMLLLEDQYGINDVVKIANISGQVEGITLRRTALRDGDGTIHFIPHSAITTVSNMTHRWARAFFEVHVSYKEDVDRVMQVLLELCKELRADPAFNSAILEEPEMLGVDQLGENGIAIQFQLRTSPSQQWSVKRELLRRIKARFDQLGIELSHREVVFITRAAALANGKQERQKGQGAAR